MASEAPIKLIEAIIELGLHIGRVGPSVINAIQLSIRLLRSGDEPTASELDQIEQALKEAHDELQAELTRKLK